MTNTTYKNSYLNSYYGFSKTGFNLVTQELPINFLGFTCNSLSAEVTENLFTKFVNLVNMVFTEISYNTYDSEDDYHRVIEDILLENVNKIQEFLDNIELDRICYYKAYAYSVGDYLMISIKDNADMVVVNFNLGVLYRIIEFLDLITNQSTTSIETKHLFPKESKEYFENILAEYRKEKSFTLNHEIDLIKDGSFLLLINNNIGECLNLLDGIYDMCHIQRNPVERYEDKDNLAIKMVSYLNKLSV